MLLSMTLENRENQTPAHAEVETQVVSKFAILAIMTARVFTSAGASRL
jgi:hypothetical protein